MIAQGFFQWPLCENVVYGGQLLRWACVQPRDNCRFFANCDSVERSLRGGRCELHDVGREVGTSMKVGNVAAHACMHVLGTEDASVTRLEIHQIR